MFVGKKEADGWGVPDQVGQGDTAFAFQGANRLTLVSNFGIYTSEDLGATFAEFRDGDTTAGQLRGTGGAWTGERLVAVQTYNYANAYAIAAILSDGQGASWPKRVILQQGSTQTFSPIAASDGHRRVVAWIAGGAVWAILCKVSDG